MKYFIAHLLKGDAAKYHRALTHELSSAFHTAPLHEKVAPHITVKIPFEANDYEIAQVESRLRDFTRRIPAPHYTLQGFGRFGHKTVYLDVVKSRDAVLMVRDCVRDLNELPWMQQVHHEGNKLHASVARFMTYKQFRRVWRHVKTERPHYKAHLDSLAILKKEAGDKMWHVHREFAFEPVFNETLFTQPVFIQ